MHRRAFLRAGAVGLAATAGCVGRIGGGSGKASGSLRLDSLDVGGSPGGPVSITPPWGGPPC